MKRTLPVLLALLFLCSCTQNAPIQSSELPVLHWLVIGGDSEAAAARISEAVSEQLEKDCGFRVKMQFVQLDEFDDTLSTLRLKHELPDLITFPNSEKLIQLTESGELLALDELLDMHPLLKNVINYPGEWMSLISGNRLYGMPFNNIQPYYLAFSIRRELCEELGVNPAEIQDLDGLEILLLQIREKYPDMLYVAPNYSRITTPFWCVPLTDNNEQISLCVFPMEEGAENELVLFTDIPEFEAWCRTMYRWNQLGLISPDAPFNSISRQAYLNLDSTVGCFQPYNQRLRADLSIHGRDEVFFHIELSDYRLDLSVSNPCYAIASDSKMVTQAMELLEKLYTDPDFLLLCTCGQEGRDYLIDEQGCLRATQLERENHIITLWCWPCNNLLTEKLGVPVEEPDLVWHSAAEGFEPDETQMETESRMCEFLISQYYLGLIDGALNPETVIPQLRQELIDAGAEQILAETQRQYDAWKNAIG